MFKKPLGLLGIFLIVVGIGYFVGAGVAYSKVQGGYTSLQSFSEAQNVELSYNEDGATHRPWNGRGRPGDHVAARGRLGLPGGGR